MIFELIDARVELVRGDWDQFQVRNLGLAVQHCMAKKFGGDAERMRDFSLEDAIALLGIKRRDREDMDQRIFGDFALLLALVPDLTLWSRDEKELTVRIIKAKAGMDEAKYLKLMQQHPRLRESVIRLGSLGSRTP
jgi:hypothetical protein